MLSATGKAYPMLRQNEWCYSGKDLQSFQIQICVEQERGHETLQTCRVWASGYAGCFLHVYRHIMESIRLYIRGITSNQVALEARGKLFRNIMKQDVAFFDTTKSAEIVRRLGIVTNEMSHVWIRIDGTLNNTSEMSKFKVP